MLTVEQYGKIRTAKRDGMSVRAICRTYHHSHHTVGKALNNPQPRPYTRTKPTVAPVLGPFMHIIDQILLDDRSEPTKQRHKASKIFLQPSNESTKLFHAYKYWPWHFILSQTILPWPVPALLTRQLHLDVFQILLHSSVAQKNGTDPIVCPYVTYK